MLRFSAPARQGPNRVVFGMVKFIQRALVFSYLFGRTKYHAHLKLSIRALVHPIRRTSSPYPKPVAIAIVIFHTLREFWTYTPPD
jgi:hypothetical protein